MGKVTVQRGPDGQVEHTWERQSPDRQNLMEALEAAVDAMAGRIVPAAPIPTVGNHHDDLLTLYTFTDYHVGMLAWHKEGGADWDLDIAERTGIKAMAAMAAGAPPSARAVVNIQGDFLHWDGLTAITPQHGHVLDADGHCFDGLWLADKLRHLILSELA